MENRKPLELSLIIILLIIIFSPLDVLAYSASVTHPFLTDKAIDLFNSYNGEISLNEEDRKWIKMGAEEEDSPITRTFFHFYDPVYDKGIFGSKNLTKWVHDDEWQKSIGGDYTWDNALRLYSDGDRMGALITLGHVIHLLQDMSVPDHTRNDIHPPGLLASPYEEFAKSKNEEYLNQKIKNLGSMRPSECFDVNDCIIQASVFSNNNFFSEDSIFDFSYEKPLILGRKIETLSNGEEYIFGWGSSDSYNHRLVRLTSERNFLSGEFDADLSIKDKDELVLEAYWSILSRHAIQDSARLIEIFVESSGLSHQGEIKGAEIETGNIKLEDRELEFLKVQLDDIQNDINLLALTEKINKSKEKEHFEPSKSSHKKNSENFSESNNVATSTDVTKDWTLASSTISVIVPIQPTSLYVEECDFSLSNTSCVIPNFNVNVKWDGQDNYFSLYDGYEFIASTTDSHLEISLLEGYHLLRLYGSSSTSSIESSLIIEPLPLIISEIAWAGTKASTGDEWIEIENRLGESVNLDGFLLCSEDGSPCIDLLGEIEANDFFLIERTDDNVVSDIRADMVTPFSGVGGSGLSNAGEHLILEYKMGKFGSVKIDETPLLESCDGWCRGSIEEKKTMERYLPSWPGSEEASWWTNDGLSVIGKDSDGNKILGTPRAKNSSYYQTRIGYYCNPYESSYELGGYYTQINGVCTYIMPNTVANWYGLPMKGTFGNAIHYNGHLLGKGSSKTEFFDIPMNTKYGDEMFVAIFAVSSVSDIYAFWDFFEKGIGPPPNHNYGVLSWKWGSDCHFSYNSAGNLIQICVPPIETNEAIENFADVQTISQEELLHDVDEGSSNIYKTIDENSNSSPIILEQ